MLLITWTFFSFKKQRENIVIYQSEDIKEIIPDNLPEQLYIEDISELDLPQLPEKKDQALVSEVFLPEELSIAESDTILAM